MRVLKNMLLKEKLLNLAVFTQARKEVPARGSTRAKASSESQATMNICTCTGHDEASVFSEVDLIH